MDLLEYLAIWGRRWRIIVATTVLGVGVAAVVSAVMQPKYVATAEMFVTTTGGASVVEAYQGNLFGQERVRSYVQLAMGRQIAQRTVDQLDINLDPEALQSMVTATAVPNSVLMTISVTNPDATVARDLANAVAVQTSQLVEELETSVRGGSPAATATLIDDADLPQSPSSPKWIPNLLYGLLGGLLVGLTAAIARDKLDHSVRNADDAGFAAGAPVLVDIPDRPADSPGLPFGAPYPEATEAFRSLRTAVLASGDSRSTGAILVTAPDEQTATVALGLAAALAESGRSVVAVETNLHDRALSKTLDLGDSAGLTDVLSGTASVNGVVVPSELAGLSILPGGTPTDTPSQLLSGQAMIELLKSLCAEYDEVVLEASPVLQYSDSLVYAEWTDGILLVSRTNSTTVKQVAQSAERIGLARANIIGVVTTKAKRRARVKSTAASL